MCDLRNLTETGANCFNKVAPGTEIDLYYTCICELNGFPRTITENGGWSAQGDDVRLSEAFDFSLAASGAGYWRLAKILVDTGGVKMGVEGELGGQSPFSELRFFIVGTDAAQVEFAENLVSTSGYISAMIRQRQVNDYNVIGRPELPAYVQSLEMDSGEKSGDRRGGAYVLRYPGPLFFYDATLYGIDVTPNP